MFSKVQSGSLQEIPHLLLIRAVDTVHSPDESLLDAYISQSSSPIFEALMRGLGRQSTDAVSTQIFGCLFSGIVIVLTR